MRHAVSTLINQKHAQSIQHQICMRGWCRRPLHDVAAAAAAAAASWHAAIACAAALRIEFRTQHPPSTIHYHIQHHIEHHIQHHIEHHIQHQIACAYQLERARACCMLSEHIGRSRSLKLLRRGDMRFFGSSPLKLAREELLMKDLTKIIVRYTLN